MGSHSVTCHPAEVTLPPLPQPIKAGTRFIDPRGMQGRVDLVGLVRPTYRGRIPARRRSPIPALTGLNVEQLRSCDERHYHSANPPTKVNKDVEDRSTRLMSTWVFWRSCRVETFPRRRIDWCNGRRSTRTSPAESVLSGRPDSAPRNLHAASHKLA